jgi:hypothetical protein
VKCPKISGKLRKLRISGQRRFKTWCGNLPQAIAFMRERLAIGKGAGRKTGAPAHFPDPDTPFT